jgi:hypothetical protein
MSKSDERDKNAKFSAIEMIETEKTYLSRLQAIFDVYMTPLRNSHILEPVDFDLQFGSWEEMYRISKDLYEKLSQQRESQNPQIGKIFFDFCEVYNI